MVLVGIISLLMIIPAMVCISQLGTAQILPDQAVTRTENDVFETSWIVIYDNSSDNVQIQMWSAQVPNLAAVQAVDENAVSITSTNAETGSVAVYPCAPWIVSLLQIIVPLSLVASAVIAFSKVVAQVNIHGKMQRYFGLLGHGGTIKIGELIGVMVSVLFAVVLLVKITPIIYEYATELTGFMGFGILISLIPIVLLIGVFWKVFQEVIS